MKELGLPMLVSCADWWMNKSIIPISICMTVAGRVIFEMATGFPVNYADNINLDPGRKRLTLHRKEELKDIHFEYLKAVTHPEVVQVCIEYA